MVARYDQKQYRQNAACSPSLLFLCFFPQLDQAFPPFSFGKWQQETRSHEDRIFEGSRTATLQRFSLSRIANSIKQYFASGTTAHYDHYVRNKSDASNWMNNVGKSTARDAVCRWLPHLQQHVPQQRKASWSMVFRQEYLELLMRASSRNHCYFDTPSESKALSSLRLGILTEFTKLQDLRISAHVDFQRESRAEQDRRREKILQLLGDVNPYAKHQEAAKRRYADIGKWSLVDDLFKKWFDLDHCVEPLIWLNGMPGAGKTVLASMIVEEAQNLSGATMAFSYCKHYDTPRQRFLHVARDILSQLVQQHEGLIPHLYEQLSNSGQNPLSTDTLAKSLLEAVF
ncbi:hypothetical protein E6O75_ATG10516 [Venturia nashicola]|uniref:Nephrocystin 3-like N-terminal domain-containing protein n=1 Tax=Venturia nashicola TaxID=86259 RepID=A0A4Z1NTL5_9PEZI|nr:hypothetical protein E6O75_ATG10516 [Venturia nashicola]